MRRGRNIELGKDDPLPFTRPASSLSRRRSRIMHTRHLLIGVMIAGVAACSTPDVVQAPRFWNDQGLSEWATPVAGLNVRPGHFSEREYYAAPNAEWVRTYPVYF